MMDIPRSILSALSEDARQVMKEIDLLIDAYEVTGKHPDFIEVWSSKWGYVQKSLKKHKHSLETDFYRGFKLVSKKKPRRYNKKKLREFEAFI